MGFTYNKLKGKIVEICGNCGVFAEQLGINHNTLTLKLDGRADWKQREIVKSCEILHIRAKEIPDYFFNK